MANPIYIHIINKNQHRFAAGQVIYRRTLCKLFRLKNIIHTGEFTQVQRSNLALVGVQAEINKILSDSGLRLKSENYYSRFVVCDKEQTKGAILAQQERADAHKECSDSLERGMGAMIKAGTWGTYQHTVTPLTGQVTSSASTQYLRKKKRIKLW